MDNSGTDSQAEVSRRTEDRSTKGELSRDNIEGVCNSAARVSIFLRPRHDDIELLGIGLNCGEFC